MVVGVIVLAIAIMYFSSTEDKTEPQIEQAIQVSGETGAVSSFVEQCIEEVGKEAIMFIGSQGGYYYPPNISENLPYYFFNNQVLVPTIEEVEKQLSLYMDEQLFFCFRNFVSFNKLGIIVKQGEINSETKLQKNQLRFNVNLDLEIKRGDITYNINKFTNKVENVRLLEILEIIKQMIAVHTDNMGICVSCVAELAFQNDLFFDIQRVGNDDFLFTILDKQTVINGEPFVFMFLNRHNNANCEEIPEYISKDAKIKIIAKCLEDEVTNARS